jgi:hypothetical protein
MFGWRVGAGRSTVVSKVRRRAPSTLAPSSKPLSGRYLSFAEREEFAIRHAQGAGVRIYVQDRLAGMVVAESGAAVPGPTVPWKGRRHGPRKDRRWASAWSPEQIAHRLRHDFPYDETMRISHEAIYQSLYVQGRGALRRELTACPRTGRALRVPRARSRGRGKSFILPEIMISERPAEVADRAGARQQTSRYNLSQTGSTVSAFSPSSSDRR